MMATTYGEAPERRKMKLATKPNSSKTAVQTCIPLILPLALTETAKGAPRESTK